MESVPCSEQKPSLTKLLGCQAHPKRTYTGPVYDFDTLDTIPYMLDLADPTPPLRGSTKPCQVIHTVM